MTILVFFSNLNHSMMWGRADSDMIYCFFFLIYFSAHGVYQDRVPCKWNQFCEPLAFIEKVNKSQIGFIKY